jgi:hypothetical protein
VLCELANWETCERGGERKSIKACRATGTLCAVPKQKHPYAKRLGTDKGAGQEVTVTNKSQFPSTSAFHRGLSVRKGDGDRSNFFSAAAHSDWALSGLFQELPRVSKPSRMGRRKVGRHGDRPSRC